MEKHYPKVSIVVPTYNRADYLKECLDSIIKQDYPNLEIIVSDDNSTDNTFEVVKNFQRKYPFIKYVKNNKYPQGPNGNKNNGLDYATGEIIGIFDDDDIMLDGAIKLMIEKINEGYDVVMGNCKILSHRKDNGSFSGKGLNKSGEIKWENYLCGKINGEFWHLFKRNILNNKRFDIDMYGGEANLWKQIFKNKKIFYFHKAVRIYRIHSKSVSKQIFEKPHLSIKNYEYYIQYFFDDLKNICPCYLSYLFKEAAYFAKLSSNIKKAFFYTLQSIRFCPKYKSAYIMLFVNYLPKKFIPFLSKLRVFFKTGEWGYWNE